MSKRVTAFIEHKKKNERGNLFIFFLGTIMIMLAFLGLAIDSAATVNARQSAQNALTSSTVAAATQISSNGRINAADAKEVAIDLYMKNRRSIGIIRCATRADVPTGGSLVGDSRCPFVMTAFTVRTAAQNSSATNGRITTASVTMSVRECSPNFFLRPVMKEMCFTVTSTGRLSNATEQR